MKSSVTFLAFFTCFCTCSAFGQGGPVPGGDTLSYLRVDGKITNASRDANDPCRIELWSSARLIDSLILDHGKLKFSFVLPCNSFYTIRMRKKGFADRLVCLNTFVPRDADPGLFRFSFETTLINMSEARSLNQDALDFPVAIVHYHEEEKYFDYNKKYTETMRTDLYNTGKNLTARK